jgi:hypothetical protein
MVNVNDPWIASEKIDGALFDVLIQQSADDPGEFQEVARNMVNRPRLASARTSFRGLAFHDLAWHWAMLRLKGEMYWQRHPDLAKPSAAYEALD